jgi:hypothetical protein
MLDACLCGDLANYVKFSHVAASLNFGLADDDNVREAWRQGWKSGFSSGGAAGLKMLLTRAPACESPDCRKPSAPGPLCSPGRRISGEEDCGKRR